MKTNIAFDIDGVMVDFMAVAEKVLNELGHKFEFQQTRNFDILEHITPPVTKKQLYKAFDVAYARYKDIPIEPKAAELCTRLYQKTKEPVIFVTSRPIRCAHHTHSLIQRFCRVPYMIAFSDQNYGKSAYLNGIGYFVEDRRETAMQLASCGKTVLMPVRPYNQDIPDDFEHTDCLVYIKDLDEIVKNLRIFVK